MELLSVLAIISLLTGLSVPAVKGLSGASTVDAGASKMADLLSLARSQAIARHTIVRFVVARSWSGKADADLRRVSLWAWDEKAATYFQTTNWEELPTGLILEPGIPAYIRTAHYAADDYSTVRGASVLEAKPDGSNFFDAGTADEPISARYIEFLPSGSARIPGSTERRAIFVATEGFAAGENAIAYTSRASNGPGNWAQVNVDTLTGRARIYRP